MLLSDIGRKQDHSLPRNIFLLWYGPPTALEAEPFFLVVSSILSGILSSLFFLRVKKILTVVEPRLYYLDSC
jgi:RsiW-degrading membrane proteinase PrsW (M82 family)